MVLILRLFILERVMNMFVIKFIFSGFIFFSSSYLGYIYGKTYSSRLDNLIYLKQAIKVLETEIIYGATPLPQALLNVSKKSNHKTSQIFADIRRDLVINKRGLIYNSFLSIENDLYNNYCFKKKEIETFMDLGRVIGNSDRKDQEKNFIFTFIQLDEAILEAKSERDKNEKLYRSLGIITGIGIIIILL